MSCRLSRFWALALVALSTLGLSAAAAAQVLDFWAIGLHPDAVEWLENEALPQFEAEAGVDVVLTNLSWDDYSDKVSAAGAAGIGPDVLATDGEMGVTWGQSGWMLPLNDYVEQWEGQEDLVPGMIVPDTSTGLIYAVPLWLDIRGTAYNKRLFAEAGIDPESPPQGWVELEEYVRKLTRVSEGAIQQVGLWESWEEASWGTLETFGAYIFQRQADLFFTDDYTDIAFDNPEAVETAEFITLLYQITNPPGVETTIEDQFGAFYDGLVAMTSGGTWVPKTALSLSDSWREDFGLFIGRYAPDTEPRALAFVNGIGISRFAEDPDLAWEFILWLMSDEISPMFHATAGTVSPIRTLVEEYIALQPELTPWFLGAQYAELWPNFPPDKVGSGYDIGQLAQALYEIYHGQADARTKLAEVAATWQGILDQHRAGR